MSRAVVRIEGRAIPFGRANVDTDVIIPAVHLKTLSRAGLGRHAFETIRCEPGNLFDAPENRGARILIAGENFGCGSSREHAVWALADLGIEAVIAPSFSDIFASNAFKNFVVTVALAPVVVDRLMAASREGPISIDLETMQVSTVCGESFDFSMDAFRRDCLLQGLDEIGITLESAPAIAAYEAHAPQLAWTFNPPNPDAERASPSV